MRRSRGFTLIEVMIVVAIVGILAAIALPAYGEYITRSRLTEGLSNLAGMRVKMEQFFQDNRSYAGACAVSPPTIATPPTGKYFDFSCPVAGASQYTLLAQGKGPMLGFKYTLTESNVQTTTGVAQNWAGLNAACWVLKKDGSC